MTYDPYSQPSLPDPHLLYAVRQEKQSIRRVSALALLPVVATILSFQLLPTVAAGLIHLMGIPFTPLLYQAFSCTLYLLCVGLPSFLFFGISHTPIASVTPFSRIGAGTLISTVIMGFGACLLSNIPANWAVSAQEFFGVDTSVPPPYLDESVLTQVFYMFSVAFIPPLVEELLFRGILLQSLRRYGDAFAIVASAFAFSMFHGNFTQMVFAFPCGLALGFLMVRTNCLWVPVLIHFANNLNSCILDLISYNIGESTAGVIYSYSFVTVLALAAFCLFLATLRNRSFFKLSGGISQGRSLLTGSEKFAEYLLNFSGLSLVFLSFSLAVLDVLPSFGLLS